MSIVGGSSCLAVMASPYQVSTAFRAPLAFQLPCALLLIFCAIAALVVTVRKELFPEIQKQRICIISVPATLIFGASAPYWWPESIELRYAIFMIGYTTAFLLWLRLLSLSTRKQLLYVIVVGLIGATEACAIYVGGRLLQEPFRGNAYRHCILPPSHAFMACWCWIVLGRTVSFPKHKVVIHLPILAVTTFVLVKLHFHLGLYYYCRGLMRPLTIALCMIMIAFAARDLWHTDSWITRLMGTLYATAAISLFSLQILPIFLCTYNLGCDWPKALIPFWLGSLMLFWVTREKALASRNEWKGNGYE